MDAVIYKQNRRFDRFDCLAVALILVPLAWLLPHLRTALVDDAFIYLRVAENLNGGHGWSYNHELRTNPCTSFAYPLLLALLQQLGLNGEDALLTAYGIGLGLIGLCCFGALRKQSCGFAVLIALLCVYEPALIHSVGMETSCFLSAICAASWAYTERREALCGLLAGIAALLRPDGAALVAILAGIELWIHKRIALKMLSVFLAVTLPCLGWHYIYFGALLPLSIKVKMAQSQIGWWATRRRWAVAWWKQRLCPWLTLPLAVPFLRHVLFQRATHSLFLFSLFAFGLLQFLAYSILSAPESYFWYFAPANMGFNVASFGGLLIAATYLSQRAKLQPEMYNHLKRDGFLLSSMLLLVYGCALVTTRPTYLFSENYKEAATWIKQHASEKQTLATAEIGYVGYYSGLPIVDMNGLLHTEALSHLQQGNFSWWYRHKPDWILTHSEPIWQGEPNQESWPKTEWDDFAALYEEVFHSGKIKVWRKTK